MNPVKDVDRNRNETVKEGITCRNEELRYTDLYFRAGLAQTDVELCVSWRRIPSKVEALA